MNKFFKNFGIAALALNVILAFLVFIVNIGIFMKDKLGFRNNFTLFADTMADGFGSILMGISRKLDRSEWN